MTREEAIEVYNGLINTKIKEAFEFFVPELRESEDEKRVKAIAILEQQRNYWSYDLPDADKLMPPVRRKDLVEAIDIALAYLEKQKDASKAIEAVDRIDKYIDEHLANAHDMKDSNPDKKYYRGWDDALGKMAGILQDVYSDEKQKEQKPADRFKEAREKYQVEWSEEDEEMRNLIVAIFKVNHPDGFFKANEFGTTDMRGVHTEEIIAWLKSLRPQPKVELSEDVKKTLDEVSHILIGLNYKQVAKDYKQAVEKLLYSRLSWKPSEEQIHAIIEALKYLPNNKDEWMILNTLVDVFKKLM